MKGGWEGCTGERKKRGNEGSRGREGGREKKE